MKPPISVILLVSFLKHCSRSLVRMKYLSFQREKSLSLCCQSNPFLILEVSPSQTSSAPTSEEICNNKILFEIKFVFVRYTMQQWEINVWEEEGNRSEECENILKTWTCSQSLHRPDKTISVHWIYKLCLLGGWLALGGREGGGSNYFHKTFWLWIISLPRQFHAQFHVFYYLEGNCMEF